MSATILHPGQGEVISERLTIKVAREEIVVCEMNRAQGGGLISRGSSPPSPAPAGPSPGR